jgi:prepilin-type N-terminal cleavage/methylation domain-containing protein
VNRPPAPLPSVRSRGRAFTLIEMLTTLAALGVVFGVMVSVSRYVRERSARDVTVSILARLERAMAEYVDQNKGVPSVPPLIASTVMPDEATLRRNALANNRAFVALLRPFLFRSSEPSRPGEAGAPPGNVDGLDELTLGASEDMPLCDAWGGPIVFMPTMNEHIGMAPPQRPYFFFSAGPDGKYLTRADNLYSYEQYRPQTQP